MNPKINIFYPLCTFKSSLKSKKNFLPWGLNTHKKILPSLLFTFNAIKSFSDYYELISFPQLESKPQTIFTR